MRVAILYNHLPPDATIDDQDVLIQVAAVADALGRLGHEHVSRTCTLDLDELRRWLEGERPDVVFNLVESLGGSDRLAMLATALMDDLGVAYTGNRTEATMLTNYKLLAKERLCHAGLPTAGWIVADAAAVRMPVVPSCEPCFRPQTPYIIKPVSEHASFGLDEQSVVTCATRDDLLERIRRQSARLGCKCFAEEFIEGREFNLSMLAGPAGPQVMPPAEIDFSTFPPGKQRIVDYRAKWEEGTFEYDNTPRHFNFSAEDQPLLDEMRRLAAACWPLFGLDGYVRVDFRVDQARRPWILEINTNPCISPEGGFAAAVDQAGVGYVAAIQRILDAARL